MEPDPYISSLRKLSQKKLKSFAPEAVDLLVSPASPVTMSGVSSESCAAGTEKEDTFDEDSDDSDDENNDD